MANELERVRELIEQAVTGLDERGLSFHPEGKWSAADILEHLSLTYSGTAKGLERAVVGGKPLGTKRSVRDLLFQTTLLTFGYFPPGRKSPKMVEPAGRFRAAECVQQIKSDLERMATKLAEAESRYGDQCAVLDHPVLGPLTIPQWRKFHLRHAGHHMKQIQRLRALQNGARAAANG